MKSILITLLSLVSLALFAQQPWTAIDEARIANRTTNERTIVPDAYSSYILALKDVRKHLAEAPMEDMKDSRKTGIQLSLPYPDGSMVTFDFVESPCMSPVLAAKYPSIKSYRGIAVNNTSSVARIDFSNHGFRAIISSPSGTIYIDPYFDTADEHYISYYVADHKLPVDHLHQSCGVQDYLENHAQETLLKNNNVKIRPSKNRGEAVTKITYRFALATTGRWAQQQGGTVDAVLPKLVTATNRLNSLLEKEAAIKFELIDNNDELIFSFADDPYSDPQLGGVTLSENSRIINSTIGLDNYDAGHVFTTQCTDGVAGIANPSSVCTNNKAAGVSCIGNNNIDNFVVSTMAHEIGHQFSCGHTWAACSDANNNQFASASSCEPGSGKSILSYSGLCSGANNTGPDINLYHSCSLEQMKNFVELGNGAQCGEREVADNHHPDVWIDMQGGFTIPIATPFELTGDASDMDGDELIYSWEQIDVNAQILNLGNNEGPLFVFETPSTEKTRLFPRLRYILRNEDWREERLPVISRNLTFRFVARDNNPTAGGVSWADIAFESSDTAGPFVVTGPGPGMTTTAGKTMEVTWDVANTDNDVVNCQFVDIYLSTNEGESFDHLLLGKTPNDGSANVVIPNVATLEGRIKVKASNNAFFNVNSSNISITQPTAPGFVMTSDTRSIDLCLPDAVTTTIAAESILNFDEMVTLEIISDLPAGTVAEFGTNPLPVNGTTSLSLDMTSANVDDVGLYEVIVQATAPGADTTFFFLNVDAGNGFLDDFQLMSPASGTSGLASFPDFEWVGSDNADGYRLEVATSPAFGTDDVVLISETGLNTTGSGRVNIENSTLYYWRVIAYNSCFGEYYSPISTFASNALSCETFVSQDTPLSIPSAGTPTVDAVLDIESTGNVTDLNVKLIKGSHTKVNSLRASIISPSLTKAVLWEGKCSNTPTINAGFDDQSSFPNGCPNFNGERMQPQEPLSIFIGESVEGNWSLQIEDVAPANGGSISDFELELCSDKVLNNPFIVNNEVLEVRTGSSNYISNDQLLCQDDNNSAEELLYTLVIIPTDGYLSNDGERLVIGDQFTQAELSSSAIRYHHTGFEDGDDNFVFTLIDGEGGWIEMTNFFITTNADGPSNTEEPISSSTLFDIYPNPTSNILHVTQSETDNTAWSYNLFSTEGKLVMKAEFRNATKINLSQLPNGIYYLHLNDGQRNLYKKVMKSE